MCERNRSIHVRFGYCTLFSKRICKSFCNSSSCNEGLGVHSRYPRSGLLTCSPHTHATVRTRLMKEYFGYLGLNGNSFTTDGVRKHACIHPRVCVRVNVHACAGTGTCSPIQYEKETPPYAESSNAGAPSLPRVFHCQFIIKASKLARMLKRNTAIKHQGPRLSTRE